MEKEKTISSAFIREAHTFLPLDLEGREEFMQSLETTLTQIHDQAFAEGENQMAALLPEHEASLHITHNQHKAYYESIENYIKDKELDEDDWATPTSKQRAIETNSLWELQWYPNTPVGFNVLYGATLEEILKAITPQDKEDRSRICRQRDINYDLDKEVQP